MPTNANTRPYVTRPTLARNSSARSRSSSRARVRTLLRRPSMIASSRPRAAASGPHVRSSTYALASLVAPGDLHQ